MPVCPQGADRTFRTNHLLCDWILDSVAEGIDVVTLKER
jgi:hypothetical protein